MEAITFATCTSNRHLLPHPKLPTFSTHVSTTLTLRSFRKQTTSRHQRRYSTRPIALQRSDYDVVVVGAGIIGLTIARQFLLESDLSVAVVDARVPFSGATGAGQGYIWMGHKTPGDDAWELSLRSKQLWEDLAESLERKGMDPFEVLGWKKTGSLLVGRNYKELSMLENRVGMFRGAGLKAEYLSSSALISEEPEVGVGQHGGAAYFPDDCQLDAMQAVSFIEKGNRYFSSEGRYAEFFDNPAMCLVRSTRNGDVEAIKTTKNALYGRKAVVIAAGAWSGSLMQSLVKSKDIPDIPVKPRKGHLLVLENPGKIQLNHGIMEMGYMDHVTPQAVNGALQYEKDASSISMTATLDTTGNLVLGSSRQFCGFSTEIDEDIVEKIWKHACEFFPSLRELHLDVLDKTIRVGLRPWMPDGKPIIGPVPGLPKLVVATGHEGSGLCMALGTAEMVADIVLGNTAKIAHEPFSFQARPMLIGNNLAL